MRRLVALLLLALLGGCSSDSSAPAAHPDVHADGVAVGETDGSGIGGLPFQELYDAVLAAAVDFPATDGNWAEDFGDASYYGPVYFLLAGQRHDRPDLSALGETGLSHAREVVRAANESGTYLLTELEEVQMAILGVLECLTLVEDPSALGELDALIDTVNELVEGFGTYLDVPLESYALDTYGPTTVTAEIALMNLRYAALLDTARNADRVAQGVAIIAAIDEIAWNGSFYRFRPDSEDLYLYPNVIMILANAMAFEVTGDEAYRERAVATYEGMQSLKDEAKGCYRSPYSAAYMGATTDDYSTLSSQNFTMMALALLYEMTGDASYRDEITALAAFLEGYLLRDGRLYHHWMDGRLAIPSDPEYFCTGCNLQFLYVALYAEEHVYGRPDPNGE